MSDYESIGRDIGKMCLDKNRLYGDSIEKTHRMIEILYPNGVATCDYRDFLTLIRILDKCCRMTSDAAHDTESQWIDVAGYAIVAEERRARAQGGDA